MHCKLDFCVAASSVKPHADSYRPQEVLVSDQQPDDVGCAGSHGVLLLLRNLGAKALKHEDVGRHDDGDVVEGHFVLGLVVDYTLEKLQ